jgi:hypothetical protein
MNKKPALSASLVAVKGKATPISDMPARSAPAAIANPPPPDPEPVKRAGEELQPLNFRISASFRREFKTYAAVHDMKLNELLRHCFEAYRKQQND